MAGPRRMSGRLRQDASPEHAPVDEGGGGAGGRIAMFTGARRNYDLSRRATENLRAFGPYYNEPGRAILCSRCEFALKRPRSTPAGEKHRVLGRAQKALTVSFKIYICQISLDRFELGTEGGHGQSVKIAQCRGYVTPKYVPVEETTTIGYRDLRECPQEKGARTKLDW